MKYTKIHSTGSLHNSRNQSFRVPSFLFFNSVPLYQVSTVVTFYTGRECVCSLAGFLFPLFLLVTVRECVWLRANARYV